MKNKTVGNRYFTKNIGPYISEIFNRSGNSKGATVFEALLTVSIVTIVVMACTSVLLAGSNFWKTNAVKTGLNQELRKAMDFMTDELRQAGYLELTLNTSVPADGVTYTTITFKKAVGVISDSVDWSTDTIQYLLGGANDDQLQRQEGSDNKVIAQNIQTLEFMRQSTTPNILEVNLHAQKSAPHGDIDVNASFKIRLRN